MTHLDSSSSPGFRELSPKELEVVSGGILVNGNRGGDRWGWDTTPSRLEWEWLSTGLDQVQDVPSPSEGGEYDPDAVSSEAPLDLEEAKLALDAFIEALKQLEKKYGPFEILFDDGTKIPVSQLLDGLGKMSAAAEAGVLAVNALNGDPDVAALAGFLVGLGVAASMPATAPALLSFFVATAAGKITEYAVNEFIGYADGKLAEKRAELAQQAQSANPNTTPGIAFIEYMIDLLNPAPDWLDFYERYPSDPNTHQK